ncbi:MAG: ankyrin repeat domain-containing protein [Bacteroidota bacterium]
MGGNWKEMFEAAASGDIELVRYHIRMGVDINYQHPEYLTSALIESVRLGNQEMMEFLLEKGADPTIREVFGGMTALDVAKVMKRKEMARYLKQLMKQS